jgi:hypothetical protein
VDEDGPDSHADTRATFDGKTPTYSGPEPKSPGSYQGQATHHAERQDSVGMLSLGDL